MATPLLSGYNSQLVASQGYTGGAGGGLPGGIGGPETIGGMASTFLVTQGYGSAFAPGGQTFRETLLARLSSIPEVAAIVGSAIYPGALPQTHDLGRDGPALSYSIVAYPRGHVLTGSDGTATARVQFSVWAYDLSIADKLTLALWSALDGPPVNPWGDGTIQVVSVVHEDESDQFEAPRAGGDQWTYQIVSEYSIKHRTIIPTLT